jgi:hypothetical protein
MENGIEIKKVTSNVDGQGEATWYEVFADGEYCTSFSKKEEAELYAEELEDYY